MLSATSYLSGQTGCTPATSKVAALWVIAQKYFEAEQMPVWVGCSALQERQP